ncbi:MAG TPA: MmcQ/YjbR family DNA-binding protein [Candidatus Nitrosotalea sp.]|nr:MmcQ/YjbR family DNA-binding protein [Candidatus Nitrosotalea sp.]
MTPDGFRRLALSLDGAVESAHMNHPDFRVAGKIFATLFYPDERFGMVKLTPEQQADLVHDAPEVFTAVPGGWGLLGATRVILRAATKPVLMPALEAAWHNAFAAGSKRRKKRSARVRPRR